jgi:hypothetical protein
MRLIRQLFGGFAEAKIRQAREQWRRGMVLTGVTAVCAVVALCGFGFMAAAAYLALREILLPWQAALIVGGAALALSLIGVLSARVLLARRPAGQARAAGNPGPHHDEAQVERIAELGRALGEGLSRHGIHTADVMLGALLAGALLGASPGLRDKLLGRRRGARNAAARDPERRTRGR